MRKLLPVLVALLAAGASQAQQLHESFVTNFRKGTVYFNDDYYLLAQGRFKHSGTGCTGPYFGSGTFRIIGDSLVLRYDDWADTPATATLDTTSYPGNSQVVVQVRDAATQRLVAGAPTWLSGSTTGSTTYETGQSCLTINPKPGDSLIVDAIGYKKFKFALQPAVPQFWLVMLVPENGRIPANTRLSFSLATWTGMFRTTNWLENRKWLAIYERQMRTD